MVREGPGPRAKREPAFRSIDRGRVALNAELALRAHPFSQAV
jgi:hypothetical protein